MYWVQITVKINCKSNLNCDFNSPNPLTNDRKQNLTVKVTKTNVTRGKLRVKRVQETSKLSITEY